MNDKEEKLEKYIKNYNCIDLSMHGAAYIKDDNLIYEKVETFYDDEILKRIQINEFKIKTTDFTQTEKFVQNYGFQFRYSDSFYKRQISDLWRWIKKVYFSKQTNQNDPLMNINSQLNKLYNQPCKKIYGFDIYNEKNEFFNCISWKELSVYKLKEMCKKEIHAKEEFSRYLFFKAMNFQFETMIKLIQELKKDYFDKNKYLNFNEKEIKEIEFIYNNLKLFHKYLTNPDIDQDDQQLQILQNSILSLKIDLYYLKFIQLILSGKFNEKKEEILELEGINFLDRLIFVMKFLNKDSKDLIKQYKLNSIEYGRLEAISLFGNDQEKIFNILQTYLDKTSDILTVGLASIVLEEIYSSLDLNKFTSAFNNFVNDLGLYNLKGIIKKELLNFKNQYLLKNKPIKSQIDNSIILCFFCKRKPNEVTIHQEEYRDSYLLDKYTKVCLHCQKNLNKCSICLQTIEEKKFYDQNIKTQKNQKEKEFEQEYSNLILWCLNCHHGGHTDHLSQWFQRNDICPVNNCNCTCNHQSIYNQFIFIKIFFCGQFNQIQ